MHEWWYMQIVALAWKLVKGLSTLFHYPAFNLMSWVSNCGSLNDPGNLSLIQSSFMLWHDSRTHELIEISNISFDVIGILFV